MNDPVIDAINVSVYEIPTDENEADGTLAWDKTTLIVVEVGAAGLTGIGYTYAGRGCVSVVDDMLTDAVVGRPVLDISGAWESMVRAIRNLGRPGLVSCAISAVDTALWDLKGKLLSLPVSRLLGVVHPEVPIYGSGGFTTYDSDTTRRQIEKWVSEWEIPRVKIKIGESWGGDVPRDLARVALAREITGSEVDLFVDANGGYTRKQAVRLAGALEQEQVSWFEEPVSSDDLTGLREVREMTSIDVTAGEYGYALTYFDQMLHANAVDCLQIDVTRCGGITEWVRVAALAASAGLQVSGHCAPNLHAHVAASVPNLRHLEYFHDHVRIENALFDGALDPTGGTLKPDPDRPGHGLEFKATDAEKYRVA